MGTISPSPCHRDHSTVHPHGRGDNVSSADPTVADIGSPPRAWGQSGVVRCARRRLRFTPTGVGTIVIRFIGIVPAPVHPHGRGDNDDEREAVRLRFGSPPRAWGQCRRRVQRLPAARFTPAGVGTIGTSASIRPALAVHPHGRGDNRSEMRLKHRRHGSPPRAWGQSCN